MKKVISSKTALVISSCLSVLSFVFSFLALGLELFGLADEKGAGFLSFGMFLLLSFFCLWYLNRSACVIWVENGTVKRKGLIWGFYKECPVDSIQMAKIQYAWREGNFIYLVDNSKHQFDRTRTDSYICFRKTKKNLDFLSTFWSGVIEN